MNRRRIAFSLLTCLSLWLASCGTATGVDAPDSTVASDSGGAPTAWIGGANDDGMGFVDWRAGTAAPTIIMGPQGGQHIYVSVRTQNLWPKKIRLGVEMRDALTDEVVKPGRIEITSSLKADEAWMAYAGMTAFVKEPCKITGRKLKVHLDVSDLYGVKATDDAVITPHWEGYCAPSP